MKQFFVKNKQELTMKTMRNAVNDTAYFCQPGTYPSQDADKTKIDALTFTIGKENLNRLLNKYLRCKKQDEDYVRCLSDLLIYIFGSGVQGPERRGNRLYRKTFNLSLGAVLDN